MLEISKEDLEDKQPDINISMLGVYDSHFFMNPGGRCRDCWMCRKEDGHDEDYDSWCNFYRYYINDIEYNPDCRVSSIIVKERK